MANLSSKAEVLRQDTAIGHLEEIQEVAPENLEDQTTVGAVADESQEQGPAPLGNHELEGPARQQEARLDFDAQIAKGLPPEDRERLMEILCKHSPGEEGGWLMEILC
mgnify:CR=1 FL=1